MWLLDNNIPKYIVSACFLCLCLDCLITVAILWILLWVSGLVWKTVRNLDVWRTIAFNTANFHPMGNLLMVHGTCKNHYICAGNNGTAAVTAGTTACLLGRKKDRNLVTSLSSIMGNGPFSVFMASRFPVKFIRAHFCCNPLMLILLSYMVNLAWIKLFMFVGARCCCFLCSQSCHTISWLDILFHPSTLQVAFEARQENLLWVYWFMAYLCPIFYEFLVLECCISQ